MCIFVATANLNLNSMRLFLVLICVLSVSCSEKKKNLVFFQPVNAGKTTQISAVPSDSSHFFSDDFWNYIVSHFESGSLELFYLGQLPYPTSLMADSTYCFSIVSWDNRDKLLQYFPKDLSEKESLNYTEGQTLRPPEGKSGIVITTRKSNWKPAPAAIEKEYLQFYKLLADKKQDQALVMKKSYQKTVLIRLRKRL